MPEPNADGRQGPALNPQALRLADLARILSALGTRSVTVEMLEADLAAGAPTNTDGTISPPPSSQPPSSPSPSNQPSSSTPPSSQSSSESSSGSSSSSSSSRSSSPAPGNCQGGQCVWIWDVDANDWLPDIDTCASYGCVCYKDPNWEPGWYHGELKTSYCYQ